MTEPLAPPDLRPRDFARACFTVTYAGWYGAANRRWFTITFGAGLLLVLAATALIGGPRALIVVAIGIVPAVVAAAILLTLICAGILGWNLALPHRHVWALPGGRAVLTARETATGWRADNASAFPVGRGVAAPLLDAAVAYINAHGGFASVSASSMAVAEYYARRYGASIRRIGPARIVVAAEQPSEQDRTTARGGEPHGEIS